MEKTIVIDTYDLIDNYPHIGTGGEGDIYKYNSDIAIKLIYCYRDKALKYNKIKALSSIQDNSFCFPRGFVDNLDGDHIGYYMNLVKLNSEVYDFNYLSFLKEQKKKLEYLIKADEAIERIHTLGVTLGDVRSTNILIDKDDNPIFIDTDSYAYKKFGYDIDDIRLHWLERTFHKKFSKIDNDKYVYALIAMDCFSHYANLCIMQSNEFFKKYISLLNVDNEVKEGLREIFSDSRNKPYIGPILKKIKPDTEIISMDDIDECLDY